MLKHKFEGDIFEEQVLSRANNSGWAFLLCFGHRRGPSGADSLAQRWARWAQRQLAPVLGMKVEFYEFFAFLRSRRPFPFFDGINRSFCQQRIAANHLSELHPSARRNHDSHPDGSMDLRPAG